MATITPTLAGPSSHSYESTFAGKQIVVTGHTGFKGSWLSLWLSELGANVHGYGLAPNSSDSLFDCLDRGNIFASSELADLGDSDRVAKFIHRVKPDYVFHLAAQPLVRLSYAEPLNTIATNVLGSANVLDAVRTLEKTCHTIFVTSDKCYQNREWCYSYRENDPLGGKDPYSMSKAAAELVAESYRRSYFDKHPCGSLVISVRAGNVIGGGDYSADRLIPDCVRAALADRTLIIRNPRATRPWQHVLDCLNGYLHAACLAPELNNKADRESFNFGPCDPHDHPVVEVAQAFFEAWGESTPGVEIVPEKVMAEAGYLSVSIEKAQRLLGWQPVWTFQEAIVHTAQWYAARHLRNEDMLAYSRRQLEQFFQSSVEMVHSPS